MNDEGLVNHRLEETKSYLDAELAVLDCKIPYEIIHEYINELSNRIGRFVNNKALEFDRTFLVERYLSAVSAELRTRGESGRYSWELGSVPEAIGKKLVSISEDLGLLARNQG